MKKRLTISLLAMLLPLWGLSVWAQTAVYHEDELVMAESLSFSLDGVLVQGHAEQAEVVLMPENVTQTSLCWTSSNKHVATVDDKGLVTGVGLGMAAITATTIDGSDLSYSVDIIVVVDTEAEWNDVTNVFLKNPSFDDDNGDYWNREVYAQGNDVRLGAMEVFNGTFNISQVLTGLPKGRYRLSAQGFYRAGNNVNNSSGNGFNLNDLEEGYYFEGAFIDFWNQSEQLTAYLYGGDEQQPMASVYSELINEEVEGSFYTYRNEWNSEIEEYVKTDFTFYPNNMEGGVAAFQEGKYRNSVAFDAEGEMTIGVANESYVYGNWCMFDNFKLEFKGEVIGCTGVKLNLENTELLIEQITQIQADVTPANALQKTLKWTSSNPDVVYVDQEGVIVAWKEGTAVITAMTIDGSDISDSITITVSNPSVNDTSVDFNESKDSNVNGDRLYFGADQIVVRGDDDGLVLVEIYTTDGSLVERTTAFVHNGSARVSTSHLPAGIYVARATADQTTHMECKFAK